MQKNRFPHFQYKLVKLSDFIAFLNELVKNSNKLYPSFVLITFFIIPFGSIAQVNVTLKGTVRDEKKNAIPYSSIGVYKNALLISGVISDSMGNYVMQLLPGKYTIVASSTNFSDAKNELEILSDKYFDIVMKDSSTQLEQVIVNAQKPIIENKIDRIVFNVENSMFSQGVNTLDLLKQTPRIQVSDDGEISMIGKGNTRVMINGRIVNLSGDDTKNKLKSLLSDNVAKIEVIPVPPAKYSAEGNSGLINIILKKDPSIGWRGTINAEYTQRFYSSNNQSANINYRSKKLEGSLNLGNYHVNILNESDMAFALSDNSLNASRRINNVTNMQSVDGSLEYTLSDRAKFGGSYSYNAYKANNNSKETSLYTENMINELDSTVSSISYTTTKPKSTAASAYLDYALDTTKGKKLIVTYNYSLNTTPTLRNVNSSISSDFSSDSKQKDFMYDGDNSYRINSIFLDFELPFRFAKIETGSAYTYIRNTTNLKLYNILLGQPVFDTTGSNDFLYSEKTASLYLSASKNITKKWSGKAGLRYEHTQLEGFSPTLNLTNTSSYGKLFPTGYLLYNPNEKNAISLSYSKRIARPNFNDLNPFRFYYGAYSYTSGNAYLLPSFSHNIELNYTFNNNLSIVVYGSRLLSGANHVSLFSNGVNSSTPENHFNQNRIGLNISYRYAPLSFWNINASGNVFYNKSNSYVPALEIVDAEGYGSSFRVQNTFTLNKQRTSIFSITYAQMLLSRNGFEQVNGYGTLSASYRFVFPNKKFSFLVSGWDILNQNRIVREINYAHSTLKSIQKPRIQNISFSLSYNFGNNNIRGVNRSSKNIDSQRAL